jgi:hypothetical protein
MEANLMAVKIEELKRLAEAAGFGRKNQACLDGKSEIDEAAYVYQEYACGEQLHKFAELLLAEKADALSHLQAENAELRRELEGARKLLDRCIKPVELAYSETIPDKEYGALLKELNAVSQQQG